MTTSVFKEHGMKNYIEIKTQEIQALYKSDNRPWVIGYSGGKDSTTTLQLIFSAMIDLIEKEGPKALHKNIYVITSDTLVENPLIIDFITSNINSINAAAESYRLPLTAYSCKASYEESFWTLLIGKGYPSPRQKFRWCTHRLKIKPIDRFIEEKIQEHEEVIVVLGVRSQESSSRKQTIESHRINDRLLKKHATLNNAFTYTPIESFSTDDVWGYLLHNKNPWGANNTELFGLYKDSQDSTECPMQLDENTPSCGNSRFGCWTCTVVQKDKSLTGFLNNGYYELEPLLEFRDYLMDIRNNPDYRQSHRMNGSIYYTKNADGTRKQGLGPFNLFARTEILKKLLTAQEKAKEIAKDLEHDTKLELITEEELHLIRMHWMESGDWDDTLPELYQKIMQKKFNIQENEREIFQKNDRARLSQICKKYNVDLEIIKQLIQLESKNANLKRRRNIITEIEQLLHKDWIHEDIVESLEDLKDGYDYEN
ncbi:MAG: DNA phosphorothioation system sulfurtransferase DndC [Candidatus Delongbacteria bacterium]|nr:DNA phosphorothioation system sulfurtransferase DndC [Candidatus Delongbacteria bacterium]